MASEGNAGLNARQQQILERAKTEGEVKIADLKELFQVTEMTIRRDLERLETGGSLKRTFGGAIFIGKDISLQERSAEMREEKIRIGRLAAALIRPGDSVFIDGGTTTQEIVRWLPSGYEITVVTNALNVAKELSQKQIVTVVTGGTVRESTSSLVGPLAEQAIQGMAFDRVFLGATGIHPEHGFSNSNLYEAEAKKLAIRQTSDAIVVADHTKFGTKALASFAPLGGIRRIVADRAPEGELAERLAEAGVEIVV